MRSLLTGRAFVRIFLTLLVVGIFVADAEVTHAQGLLQRLRSRRSVPPATNPSQSRSNVRPPSAAANQPSSPANANATASAPATRARTTQPVPASAPDAKTATAKGVASGGGKMGVRIRKPESGSGVMLTAVEPDSAAFKANLRVGDVVQSIDGEPVNETETLISAVSRHKPGETINVIFARSAKRFRAVVTLAGQTPIPETAAKKTSPSTKSDSAPKIARQEPTVAPVDAKTKVGTRPVDASVESPREKEDLLEFGDDEPTNQVFARGKSE